MFLADTGYAVIDIIETTARNPALLSAVIVPATTALAELPTGDQAVYTVLADVDPGAADLIGQQAPLALRPDDPDLLRTVVTQDPRELRRKVESDVTSLVAVLERRAEIGVRRALGARRRHIAGQFLTESAILGALGGIIGTSLGIIAVVTVAATRDWTTTLNPALTLPAPTVGIAAGLLAGLQPAWRASLITPATALRSE